MYLLYSVLTVIQIRSRLLPLKHEVLLNNKFLAFSELPDKSTVIGGRIIKRCHHHRLRLSAAERVVTRPLAFTSIPCTALHSLITGLLVCHLDKLLLPLRAHIVFVLPSTWGSLTQVTSLYHVYLRRFFRGHVDFPALDVPKCQSPWNLKLSWELWE